VKPGLPREQVLALQQSIGNRATARALMRTSGPRLQRMLWVVEPKEDIQKKKLSPEFAADLKRLKGNEAVAHDLEHKEVSFTVEHANRRAEHVDPAASLHLLSHAGLAPEPNIAGLSLQPFAKALVAKYSSQALEQGTIWLLVCSIGQMMNELLVALSVEGLQNVTVYAPKRVMFISAKGIPHVHEKAHDDSGDLDGAVAKYHADFSRLSAVGFQGSGVGWAGGQLINGQPKVLATVPAEKAVRKKFDPDKQEV